MFSSAPTLRTDAQIRAAHAAVSKVSKRLPKRVRELSHKQPCKVMRPNADGQLVLVEVK